MHPVVLLTALAGLTFSTASPLDLEIRQIASPRPVSLGPAPSGSSRIANFCTNPDALTCCTTLLAGVASNVPTALGFNCKIH
ncbi:hypothetical protein MBLNU230_g0360t1 [Neophaeotheca triangularis]